MIVPVLFHIYWLWLYADAICDVTCIYICVFAISNIARQQMFTLHGLAWKDYDDEVANELLDEI